MRRRLAAAAAGLSLIATAVIAFWLHHHTVTAGANTVEPIYPSVYLGGGGEHCQLISRVPSGADRVRLVITNVTGGARRLNVEIRAGGGVASRGEVEPASTGTQLVRLSPHTQKAHPAGLCLGNPGPGRIVIGGGPKRLPSSPKGPTGEKRSIASAIFLRPGSASWASQTGYIADRYANAQTGLLGGWSIWFAALLAVLAAGLAIWSVVALPERQH